MLASFSVAPFGVGEGLGEFVAGMMPLIEASGLPFKLGAMQTTIEGDEAEVLQLIMSCHRHMREKAPRVVTHIALDDRAGATSRLEGKVQDVERILGRELRHE
jgi:uncharacterized protein (TIGR00106 family)